MTGTCPICSRTCSSRVAPWSLYCPSCDHWFCNAQPDLGAADESFFEGLDDDTDPLEHLGGLRARNFGTLLAQLRRLTPPEGAVLDVGCASGQFLEVAQIYGWPASGVEPKERMARLALGKGLKVRVGFFPEILDKDENFSAIFFNDVLEHIGDPGKVLSDCKPFLKRGGYLVLSLPDSHGLFFRIAVVAYRLGFRGPYERMWQRMFYTPHLHYFSRRSLALIAQAKGFSVAAPLLSLPSISLRGLWDRISSDPGLSWASCGIQYFAALLLFPFSASAPDGQAVFLKVDHG